jgi:hypothetical protein
MSDIGKGSEASATPPGAIVITRKLHKKEEKNLNSYRCISRPEIIFGIPLIEDQGFVFYSRNLLHKPILRNMDIYFYFFALQISQIYL